MHLQQSERMNRKEFLFKGLRKLRPTEINRRKSKILMKSMMKQQWRNLRNILNLNRNATILWSSIKSNTRQRCVRTGSYLVNANSKTNAPLHMAIMSFIKKAIYHRISKQKYVLSFTLHHFALMVIDANSYIHNMTF